MSNSVSYFFLLVLGIPLDFSPNADYKRCRFSKTLLEKGFELVPNRGVGTVIFNLGFKLLPADIDPIPKEQSRKNNTLGACGTGRIKMVLSLSTKIVTLYVEAIIIQVKVPGLKWPVLECGVCLELTMLLTLNKKF